MKVQALDEDGEQDTADAGTHDPPMMRQRM
jgi:hypothetical protein